MKQTDKKRRQQWGGRFSEAQAESLRRFNDSLSFDRELLSEDIEGSLAWAHALGDAGVLSATEVRKIARALGEINADEEITGEEDVHSYVEARLHEKIGPLAGKLHTGRSRNDQVATDFKLYLKKAIREASDGVLFLTEALTSRAGAEAGTPMPGYTHEKLAEPVTFGHWCLAYVEMLLRDVDRFGAALERNDTCPLGSGALSGSPVGIDRDALAERLGFSRPTANSLDGVSDRDMALDYLFAASTLLVHLSRLSADLIRFSSDECRFVELPDALATGSSRMPHKKNPDALELVRGHAARSIGDLTGLLSLLKGLPLAYNKDLQLDKEPVFAMRRTLGVILDLMTQIVDGLIVHREAMRAAASSDLLLATELADAMAARGVPFREAHEAVGKRLLQSLKSKKGMRELGADGSITDTDLAAIDVDRALDKRDVHGGSAPSRVKKAARDAAHRIASSRTTGPKGRR